MAANPSGAYNPLFIYGPSGLGKTHLLNAIKIEIQKNHPDFNIVYVDCEKFTNETITAIKTATMEQFRQRYRKADVLLIDDIQFLAGKESTQEEFFHTFNTLHNDGRQIVIASDRPAKEIKSLEERLRTRFEWGLTADIQPPDFETRVAIVKRKAELLNLDLPNDVAEYIANHLKQNIRQLEGAVKKLNAYYLLEGIEPCIGVTTTAIKDTLNDSQPIPVTIEKILNEVAAHLQCDAVGHPRQEAQCECERSAADDDVHYPRGDRHEHGGHRAGVPARSFHGGVFHQNDGGKHQARPAPERDVQRHHEKRPHLTYFLERK